MRRLICVGGFCVPRIWTNNKITNRVFSLPRAGGDQQLIAVRMGFGLEIGMILLLVLLVNHSDTGA